MTIQIEVIADDNRGDGGNLRDCPGARALRRAFNADSAIMNFKTATVYVAGVPTAVEVEERLADAIYAFVCNEVPIPVGLYGVEVDEWVGE